MSLSRFASQQVQRNAGGGVAATAVAQPDIDDRFDLLTKYIPAETITLFVAAMSALKPIAATFPGVDVRTLYIGGAVMTPLVLLIAIIGKQRAAGVRGRPNLWPLVASLIAFLVWALCVPEVLHDDNQKIVASFGALLVSTLLAMADTLFAPKPR